MKQRLLFEYKLIRLSIASYSRIPVGGNLVFEKELLAKSVKYFPFVGVLLGSILGFSFWLMQLFLPVHLALILILSLELLLTGAMHHDGFADVCDAFGASRDKSHILTIMKDSHIGVYGVLGLIFIVLIHYLSISEMNSVEIPLIIIAGNSFSRISAPLFVATHAYVTPDETSKSKAMLSKLTFKELLISTIISLLPLFLLSYKYWSAIFLPIIISVWFMHFCKKRIGGYTGDCLGATQQITENLFYISIVIISNVSIF